MATETLKSCFRPVVNGKFSNQREAKSLLWDSIGSPASVPDGTVIGMDIYDPRLT